MAELYAHEREALAVATHRNVLIASADRVGKTFLAAMRARAWLLTRDTATATATSTNATTARVVTIAPTPERRDALQRELARVCSERVWTPTSNSDSDPLARLVILSPKQFQAMLRAQTLRVDAIGLLILEDADEIHDTAPSLYRQAFQAPTASLSIFATTRTPVSALAWDPLQNPLYQHIHVLQMVPVIAPEVVSELYGRRAPMLPLLLPEPFHNDTPQDPATLLSCAVRDFLLGENDRKVDYVRLFRLELEMGNSAAVYDDKKKQERVNRFVQDAEAVYEHLGLWCLLKHIELELQFNLRACLVEDVDNINRRRRQRMLQQQPQNNPSLVDADAEADIDGDDEDDEIDEPLAERGSETLGGLVAAASTTLGDDKITKINHILKVLSALSSSMKKLGAEAVTPRLQKAAMIARARLSVPGTSADPAAGGPASSPRCWVFVERRVHCTVVAEYLSFALADVGIPPCCSMLGNSNARIVGSLHFSTFLKVMTRFQTGATKILVTTSVPRQSPNLRIEIPQCDLVVIMDELQEADKLLDYCQRAYARGGVIKYVMPTSPAEAKKYQLLVRKFHEAAQLEPLAASNASFDESAMTTTTASLSSSTYVAAAATSTMTIETISKIEKPMGGPTSVVKPMIRTMSRPSIPAVTYEIINKDTGAKLNLENSVSILSKFCETLPGLDTYDRRPQYYIKRHQVAGPTMSASMKQAKKKKLKYNSKLEDKIDDLKAQAEARQDEDEEMETDKVDESYSSSGRFQFTAKLRLPVMVGVKKEIGSPKVSSDVQAKAIVAYKGCQELIKRGLLDRHFCSTLEYDDVPRDSNSPTDTTVYVDDDDASSKPKPSLTDLSAQNSYDLPPVSASELGLPTVRSVMMATTDTTDASEATVSMCFYGIEGIRFAILSSKELYTGNTNTGWRYNFATSDVMEPVINRVTLQAKATKVHLTKSELEEVLHFHLIVMRLACMHVDDAMREVDIKGDKVWSEFSEQNDKGYLVVPSRIVEGTNGIELDWDYLREIVGKPLLVDGWPLPPNQDWSSDEWVCVPKFRRNVCYVVRRVTDQKAGEVAKPMAEDDASWARHLKTKAVSGVPIFGRWHKRDQVKEADPDQPLIHGVQVPEIVPLIRRVMQRNHDEGSIAQSKSKFQERYLLPEYTSLLRLTKTRYFEAMGIVPLLYEFERKCQMSNLMTRIGLEVDLKLLDDATTKPAYERLEILGDTFLKLETSWYLFQNRSDIIEEGQLTQLRRDIIRNDRLNMFALAKDIHHYILYPAEVEQHPFKFWKPSCMGKTPENIVAPSKWIADVLEAMCGAYLVDQGEVGARHFLKWIGVTVPEQPHVFAQSYLPDITPNELYDDRTAAALARQRAIGFRVGTYDDMTDRLVAMQQRLKYTFNNKLLLLEAMTHPSVGTLRIQRDGESQPFLWNQNYERLEYLGDAVIEYLTLSYAYLTYTKWLPGSLTQWKSATVSNDALGKTAIMYFGIDECLLSGALRIDRESLATIASLERRYPRDHQSLSMNAQELHRHSSSKAKRKPAVGAHAVNTMALPKLFADVFEALVAAVFLDSNHNLQTVRDVFLGPLLDAVGKDAYAYVCRESGLPMDDDPLFPTDDFGMEVLRFSEEDDDD